MSVITACKKNFTDYDVELKQLHLTTSILWRNLWLGSVVAPVSVFILLFSYAPITKHLQWSAVVFFVFLARLFTVLHIKYNRDIQPDTALRSLCLFVGLVWPLWMSCCYIYFGLEPKIEVIFCITFVAIALSGVALISFIVTPYLFYLYLCSTLLPVIGFLLLQSDEVFLRLAVGVATYMVIVAYISHFFYGHVLSQRIVAQLDNEASVDQSRNEALIACNARRDKERFFTSASHDLRQPLHTLTMLVGLTEKTYGESSAVLLGNIKKALSDMTLLFDALFDSEIGKLGIKKRVVSLDETILTLIDEYKGPAKAKGIELRHRLSSCDLVTDPSLVGSVIRNILDNAVKYTQQGGVLISIRTHKKELWIQVHDTGIGISKENLERIFNTFSRIQQDSSVASGEGLGLANARKIASALGYTISLKSVVGKGSVFTLSIPISERIKKLEVDKQIKPVQFKRALYGVRLLLIEDEGSVLDATRLSLMELGAGVYAAETAKQAMELSVMHSFDLILSDYRLKGSVTGLDLVNMINQSRPSPLPFIILSGEDKHYVREAVSECKGRWLTKPAGDQEITEAILSALGRL